MPLKKNMGSKLLECQEPILTMWPLLSRFIQRGRSLTDFCMPTLKYVLFFDTLKDSMISARDLAQII
jgi:hypothetical protein